MNLSDVLFIFLSSILVFLMIPGLALFYGGLVRRKNILSVLMKCFIVIAIVSIQWVCVGYSLAFSPSEWMHGLLGSSQWFFLKGVGVTPMTDYAATIPHLSFMMFQMMFAVITPALIIGGVAERMKFSAFVVFIFFWSLLIYNPIAHWVWGLGGWIRSLGALDFAGGTVVHISSGLSALAAALILGPRKNIKMIHPSNLPLVTLGAGLLWFGWFGFNAGSALAINGIAISAMLTTHIAAAAGMIGHALLELITHKRVTLLGALTGAVAGLVAITPCAGFVSFMPAILIGLISGFVAYVMIMWAKSKFQYDDALDAFGVHGMCGIWGALATGLFASKAVNPAGANGTLVSGDFALLKVQIIAVVATMIFSFVGSYILLKIIDKMMGIRVTEKDETIGLDLSQHNETIHQLLD